jgi:hypothetical protein
MILFRNKSNKWRKAMFYDVYKDTDFVPISCNSGMLTLDETIEFAGNIRNELANQYNTLNKSKESVYCSNFRNMLLPCIPELKVSGTYVSFNPADIYDILTYLFPNLLLTIEYLPYYNDKIRLNDDGSIPTEKVSMFTMWEFIGLDDSEDRKEHRWHDVDTDILVFTNGAIPVIQDFSDISDENSVVVVSGTEYTQNIKKIRTFKKEILNKYILVGVIMLEGYIPGKESGVHYTGYFTGKDNNIYYYNDVGPILREVEEYPESIWKYSNGSIPQMYFYAKK